ncbi:MAG: HdeA family protein [Deltaproteobacteria bacterium]|nr:HdeA family protein [Deltaproteobacteria bacterium]
MKKLFGVFLGAALLLAAFWAGPVQADKVDFDKFTCGQFLELDADEMAMLYFWLDGYASAKSGDLVLDSGTVENDLKELTNMCNDNKDSRLLTVIGY